MSLRSYSFIIQHEILTWSVQLTLTPFFNIVKTMLVDPLAAAMCNAVLPFYKYKKVVPVTNYKAIFAQTTIPHPVHAYRLHF